MKRRIHSRVADEVSLPADRNSSGKLVKCACVRPVECIRSTVFGDDAAASTASRTLQCAFASSVVEVSVERCCTLASLRRTCIAIWRTTAATWRLSTMKRLKQPGTRSPCRVDQQRTKTPTFPYNIKPIAVFSGKS